MSVRIVQKEPHPTGITGRTVFGTLNFLTGRSRPLPESPKPSSRRRWESLGLPANHRSKSNYQPPPITPSLPKRERAISPSPTNKKDLLLHDQDQSPLFRLPKEVLDLICEHAVGNRLVHIMRRPTGGLGHEVCKLGNESSPNACKEQQCRGVKLATGRYAKSSQPGENFVALLQTCRKLYVAAIRVLYETTIFDFDSMESLITLSTSTLPHRYDSIQHLSFDFRFATSHHFKEGSPASDWARWERTWRVIGSMKGLKTLRARIEWHKEDAGVVTERRWLDELIQVTGLEVFELELPGLRKAEKIVDEGFRRAHGEWEFVVKRRDGMA
ncbi:hypothetical protein BKA64DRAFT_9821 [Cadophora sp. MPI-SDFR-AT-0126]|nr:hypothetical protein BKA64DRAFT_9821 [Leotiomycetes sp. MPI-SDFR-AT-0126]